VDGLIERDDVDAILGGLFDINVKLRRIDENLAEITAWLEDGEDDEEEEEDPPGSPA
jgi:hypothetical protein